MPHAGGTPDLASLTVAPLRRREQCPTFCKLSVLSFGVSCPWGILSVSQCIKSAMQTYSMHWGDMVLHDHCKPFPFP